MEPSRSGGNAEAAEALEAAGASSKARPTSTRRALGICHLRQWAQLIHAFVGSTGHHFLGRNGCSGVCLAMCATRGMLRRSHPLESAHGSSWRCGSSRNVWLNPPSWSGDDPTLCRGHEQFGCKTNDRSNCCCNPGRDWTVSPTPTGAFEVKAPIRPPAMRDARIASSRWITTHAQHSTFTRRRA